MSVLKSYVSLLLNWYAYLYYFPIIIAQKLNFYEQRAVKVIALGTDITKQVDSDVKVIAYMITAPAKAYPVSSIDTLIDELLTGLLALTLSRTGHFHSLGDKQVDYYIIQPGKRIIDELVQFSEIDPKIYETISINLDVTNYMCRNLIDVSIDLINFKKLELASLQGETIFLLLSQLTELSCCFIQLIFIKKSLLKIKLIQFFLEVAQCSSIFTAEPFKVIYELICYNYPVQVKDEHFSMPNGYANRFFHKIIYSETSSITQYL